MKGRKKLPDNIKALRGTDQPCRMTDKPAVQTSTEDGATKPIRAETQQCTLYE